MSEKEHKEGESGAAITYEGRPVSNRLLASVEVELNPGLRFSIHGGTSEWEGEKISLTIDIGCGVVISYKGKSYRFSPENLIAAVVELSGKKAGRPKASPRTQG